MRLRGALLQEGPQGIWLGDVPSNLSYAKDPSRNVTMKFLIPWSRIVAIGILDAHAMKLGFAAEAPKED